MADFTILCVASETDQVCQPTGLFPLENADWRRMPDLPSAFELAEVDPSAVVVWCESAADPPAGQVLSELLEAHPQVAVIVLSDHYSEKNALQAIRQGCHDYLPLDQYERWLTAVQRAVLRRRQTAAQAQALYQVAEAERQRFVAITTRLEQGIIILDLQDRLVLCNPSAQAAFELPSQNYIGQPIRDVITRAVTLNGSELLDILEQKACVQSYHFELVLPDGRVMDAQVVLVPEVGRVITLLDITHLKELDRVKSDFVHTVSHDLRSPLTAILGYVELLDRVGPVTAQQAEFIRRIQTSVSNITTLINDLLDLGRIEAGYDGRKEAVHLAAILHYCIDNLYGQIQAKNQTLDLDAPENLPVILGNPVQMRQMVSNLLGNAIKYTPPGGAIRVRADVEAENMILQISDTGSGIPLAEQAFIFDKFYRASNVTEDVPGTGLGLAIVQSIIQAHQGRIWVDSDPGKGTTFTVVLPVAS